MTDFLTWCDEWTLGIDWVDQDHQTMVNRLNRLAVLVRGDHQAGSEGVLVALDALIAHNRRHFRAEEAFLRHIGFPDYDAHRREHTMQIAEFLDLRRRLAHDLAQAPHTPFPDEVLEDFKRWFFNHVIAEDRVFANFYRRLWGELALGVSA